MHRASAADAVFPVVAGERELDNRVECELPDIGRELRLGKSLARDDREVDARWPVRGVSNPPSTANQPFGSVCVDIGRATYREREKFWVSRHQCGHGESAIVVLNRVFVPRTGSSSRPRVDRPAEVDVLTRRSPPGRRSLPDSGAGPGSQGWPGGPSAASCAAASLTARNSPATREIASGYIPMERGSLARARCTIQACCLKRRERLPCLPSHPVPWPEARNLTTSMPREPKFWGHHARGEAATAPRGRFLGASQFARTG